MDLNALRGQIDEADEQLVKLFCRRMGLVREVAEYKRVNSLPILHTDREQQVLERVAVLAGPELADNARLLFTVLMDLSKSQQATQLADVTSVGKRIDDALSLGDTRLPEAPVVACQGVDGAYSSIAAHKLFPTATLRFFATWDEVFRSVKDGACEIGVLPIENSTAGSVNTVYDLMKQYHVHIVRGQKLAVRHCLLTKPGVHFEELTDIYSHEQAITQCGAFLRENPHIRVHLYSNTASAARFVSECGDKGVAAIASRECADIYGLTIVLDNIKDAQRNETRFIAISNKMILTEDADRMSVALTLPHEAGSLYRLITQFAMLELNLTKLESRPLPNTDFEFLFYFDFNGNAASEKIKKLLCRLEEQCEYFEFLGNYREFNA